MCGHPYSWLVDICLPGIEKKIDEHKKKLKIWNCYVVVRGVLGVIPKGPMIFHWHEVPDSWDPPLLLHLLF